MKNNKGSWIYLEFLNGRTVSQERFKYPKRKMRTRPKLFGKEQRNPSVYEKEGETVSQRCHGGRAWGSTRSTNCGGFCQETFYSIPHAKNVRYNHLVFLNSASCHLASCEYPLSFLVQPVVSGSAALLGGPARLTEPSPSRVPVGPQEPAIRSSSPDR